MNENNTLKVLNLIQESRRTIRGIIRDTGLSELEVLSIVVENGNNINFVKSISGSVLVKLKKRFH